MDLELGLTDRKNVDLHVFVARNVVSVSMNVRPECHWSFVIGERRTPCRHCLTSMSEPSQAPILAVVVVVIARPAECVGFEMNPLPQLRIADGLGYSTRPKLGMSTCNSVGIRW